MVFMGRMEVSGCLLETLLNPQAAEGRRVDALQGLQAGRAKKLWGEVGGLGWAWWLWERLGWVLVEVIGRGLGYAETA